MLIQTYYVQRELSQFADKAARKYRDEVPLKDRTTEMVWRIMTKAEEKMIKTIRSKNFEKYVVVANLTNGDNFFHEVCIISWLLLFLSFCFFIILYSHFCIVHSSD